ncbi:MAG: hypothetical protein M1503_11250 [Thaumarchaeota archaeon]|nr:hypothetical protein [Nitrososphaerota archaeon]
MLPRNQNLIATILKRLTVPKTLVYSVAALFPYFILRWEFAFYYWDRQCQIITSGNQAYCGRALANLELSEVVVALSVTIFIIGVLLARHSNPIALVLRATLLCIVAAIATQAILTLGLGYLLP